MREVIRTASNGIKISFAKNEALHSFCIGAYIRAGSMFETVRDNGISHLYEHAVFRNLKRLYGGKLYSLLSRSGLVLDGDTYKEFMSFTIHGAADGIDFAVDIVSKLFLPLEIDEDEFEAEKNRIYCEINEDDEKGTLGWLHGRRCWGGAFPAGGIAGRRSNIERITVKKLDAFRRSVICPGNLLFCVTGNVDEEHERKLIEAVGGVPAGPAAAKRENVVPLKPGFVFGSPDIVLKDSDWYHLMLSFGFDSREIPTNIRELLYSALYDLDDAAFYQELSENDPSAYSYNGTLEQYDNIGCFRLSYETFENLLPKSLEAVVRAIDRIKRGDFDLELNKRKLAVQFTLSLDDPEGLNFDIAYYEHILENSPADWTKPALGRYEKVTMEEMTSAAKRIFTRKNLVFTMRGDRRRVDKAELEAVLSRLG